MEKKNNNWIWIVIVAAAVSALTAIAVLILRARAKNKNWYDQEAIDCDVEDLESFEFIDEDVVVDEEIVED